MSKQTLIILRGVAGVGKTALIRAMMLGQEHILGLPVLRAAAVECGLWGRSKAPYLLADPCMGAEALVAECAGQFHIIHLWLFAAPWLVEARRKMRYRHYPADTTQQALDGEVASAALVDYALTVFADRPEVETVLADACDWPLREVRAEEARAILEPEPVTLQLPPPETMYQQALWIGGECYGTTDPARREWERARLDAILPANMTGKTLLDIGAANGGFCYEAIHRGAIYATAVEVDEGSLATIRHIRDCFRLPVTICRMNIMADSLPMLGAHAAPLHYDVGLLLNVLHHCDDPGVVLGRVLPACDSVIIETPFGIGAEPYRPGLPPYPNAMHFPPAWVQAAGQQYGFALTSIEVSEMCPGQRLIYRLERQDG